MSFHKRLAAITCLLLCTILSHFSMAEVVQQPHASSPSALRMKPEEMKSAPESAPLAVAPTPSTPAVEEQVAPTAHETTTLNPRPKTPHPRRYMDQQTTAVVTLAAGGLLLLFGIATNLVRGTTSAFMAMVAGFGTICLVLGALLVIVGIAMLIAAT
jgi:hypothetical protein